MTLVQPLSYGIPPAIRRLSHMASLDPADRAAILGAMEHRRRLTPRRELQSEGRAIVGPILITEGWAARMRLLADGRRQFLSFLLPGDVIGMCHHSRPRAVSTVVALTEVGYCPAPSAANLPGLAEAYAVSQAMEEGYLLYHIVRLGRLNAQDRIADLMLELQERLDLAGLADRNGFVFPLTQEILADSLGLTSVHVNRMLQSLKKNGDLESRNGYMSIPDPRSLTAKIGRVPLRVTMP